MITSSLLLLSPHDDDTQDHHDDYDDDVDDDASHATLATDSTPVASTSVTSPEAVERKYQLRGKEEGNLQQLLMS